MTHESLLTRIRAEYSEMPGLRLTTAQACRLWQLDADTCQTVFLRLIEEQFLICTRDGAYIALPSPRRPAIRSSLSAAPSNVERRTA
jgi:hypothetical protein